MTVVFPAQLHETGLLVYVLLSLTNDQLSTGLVLL